MQKALPKAFPIPQLSWIRWKFPVLGEKVHIWGDLIIQPSLGGISKCSAWGWKK